MMFLSIFSVPRGLGFQSVEMEDAQEIVLALKKEEECLGKFGSPIADARNLLSTLQNWSVRCVQRAGNGAAHFLARRDVSHRVQHVWFEAYPDFVSEIVLSMEQHFLNKIITTI
jgi:hypothetical protein